MEESGGGNRAPALKKCHPRKGFAFGCQANSGTPDRPGMPKDLEMRLSGPPIMKQSAIRECKTRSGMEIPFIMAVSAARRGPEMGAGS